MTTAKENVLRAAVDVLPETLLAFGQDGHYEAVRRSLDEMVAAAPDVDERSLANMASELLEDTLLQHGSHAAPAARTFLAKMKRELDLE